MAETLTYENWEEQKLRAILNGNADFLDIIKWAFQEYGDEIVYSCSFGAEGIVLIDLIHKVKRDANIIFLDTELHFQETYDLIDQIKERYPTLQISIVKPKISLEEQTKWYGDDLWKHNPNLCCHMRKIVPMKEALEDVKAWFSGLRREQSPFRSKIQYINKDEKFHKVKVCPLIHWTWDDVMNYLNLNNLPYNPLHDQGYPSIGCAPCTSPVSDIEDSRSGRWTGHNKTECGLHQQ